MVCCRFNVHDSNEAVRSNDGLLCPLFRIGRLVVYCKTKQLKSASPVSERERKKCSGGVGVER